MEFKKIDKREVYSLLGKQFNPPVISADYSENMFFEEWKHIQDQIKIRLLKLGYACSNDGGNDYTMADDWGISRHHEVEINKKRMLNKNVLIEIHSFLNEIEVDYEIVIEHDIFLREDGIKPFYFIVQKNVITTADFGENQALKMMQQ